jgi:hypothetical protein
MDGLTDQGKYEEAEKMNRPVMVEHPNTLISVSNLASVLRPQGKYEEFRQWLKHGKDQATKEKSTHEKVMKVAAGNNRSGKEVMQPLSLTDALSIDDEGMVVYLTPWTLVLKPRFSDRLKGVIESLVRRPIHWWPLQERLTECAEGNARLSWNCVSELLA